MKRFAAVLAILAGFTGVSLAETQEEALRRLILGLGQGGGQIPVAIPAYTTTYYPGGTVASSNEIKLLRQEIRELRQLVEQLAGQRMGLTAAPPAFAKCAACHSDATAKAKGGGFEMFKGGQLRADMAAGDLALVATRTYAGEMPKGGKLTDGEVAQIQAWVNHTLKERRKK